MVRDNRPVGKPNRRTLHLGSDGRWPLAAVRAVPAFGADREPADALNAVRGHGEDVAALQAHAAAAGAPVPLEVTHLQRGRLVPRAAHALLLSRDQPPRARAARTSDLISALTARPTPARTGRADRRPHRRPV